MLMAQEINDPGPKLPGNLMTRAEKIGTEMYVGRND